MYCIVPGSDRSHKTDLTWNVKTGLFYRPNDLTIAQQTGTNGQLFEECDGRDSRDLLTLMVLHCLHTLLTRHQLQRPCSLLLLAGQNINETIFTDLSQITSFYILWAQTATNNENKVRYIKTLNIWKSNLLQNDVDVAWNKLSNLLPFSGLNSIIGVSVIAKILHRTRNNTRQQHFPTFMVSQLLLAFSG